MSWGDRLPDTASLYERAAMDAAEAVLPIPVRQLVDPARTTLAFLPFVAVNEGVKLWFDDWTEARKRQMAADWQLHDLIGTREGLGRFLAYVDAELISAMAHPRRFVIGRSSLDREPLFLPAYRARYLIKVPLKRHKSAFVIGRSPIGRHAFTSVDGEPIRRAKIAATVSKSPGTEYLASFAHRRRPTFDEMQFGWPFDAFIDRTSL